MFPTHPEVCVAVDHQGALDQLVGALQEVVARDDAGVVDEHVHLAHLSTHLLGCGIHTLPLPHVHTRRCRPAAGRGGTSSTPPMGPAGMERGMRSMEEVIGSDQSGFYKKPMGDFCSDCTIIN